RRPAPLRSAVLLVARGPRSALLPYTTLFRSAPPPPAPGDPKKDEVQGVFVVNGNKAVFLPVETGIAGVTDIEITKGLKAGDEIVVGSYKALRTLKPEAQVKVDNSAPKKQEDQQS